MLAHGTGKDLVLKCRAVRHNHRQCDLCLGFHDHIDQHKARDMGFWEIRQGRDQEAQAQFPGFKKTANDSLVSAEVLSDGKVALRIYAPDAKLVGMSGDWGFKGMVMTDWGGGMHAVQMMEAGNDLLEPGSDRHIQDIIKAVQDGTLDEAVLDKNIRRILEMVVKSHTYKKYPFTNEPNLKAHRAMAR